jgi:hypothetical protein
MGQPQPKFEPSHPIGVDAAHTLAVPIVDTGISTSKSHASFAALFPYCVVAAAVGITFAWIAALVLLFSTLLS